MATKKTTSKYSFKNWREAEYNAESEPGERYIPIYTSRFDDKGVLQIEEVAKDDLYAKIQSFKKECDINEIMKRYQMGDDTALMKAQGIYMDATGTPANMADLLNKLNKAEYEFAKLPPEVREKYGNDFARFICTFEPIEYAEVIKEEPEKIVEEGVKNEE